MLSRSAQTLQVDLAGATGGGAVAALLGGPPDAAALRMRLVDLAAAAGAGRKQEADARQAADADAAAAAQTDRQLVQVPISSTEIRASACQACRACSCISQPTVDDQVRGHMRIADNLHACTNR